MMWLVSQFMICQTILSLTTNQTYLWSADTMISKYKTLFSKFLNESKSTKIKTSWSSILTFKANLCLQVKMHACMWLYISIIMCPHVCMCVYKIFTNTFIVLSSFAQLLSKKRYSENHIDHPITCIYKASDFVTSIKEPSKPGKWECLWKWHIG